MNALQRLRLWWQVRKVSLSTKFMLEQTAIPFYRNHAEAKSAHEHTLMQKELTKALEAVQILEKADGPSVHLANIRSALRRAQEIPPPVQPLNRP